MFRVLKIVGMYRFLLLRDDSNHPPDISFSLASLGSIAFFLLQHYLLLLLFKLVELIMIYSSSHRCLGQPVDCIVESVNVTAMTVTLKANRKSVTEAVITESSKLSFNSLQPGMLVDAIIGSPATVIFLTIFEPDF